MITKLRIYQILEKAENGDKQSKTFDIFIILLIISNVLAIILESFSELALQYKSFFRFFELVSVIIFSAEYLLRIYTAKQKYPNTKNFKAVFKFVFSTMALIDLFAILPFYLPMFILIDLRFLRILRLTRILRVLKIQRYNNSLSLINRVIGNKKEELVVTLFITFILLLLASSTMYFVETNAQPESFPNVIASFWWAIATLTTVGYGDVYPVTILGKILSGIIALLGIGIVALPTGIISSGFVEEIDKSKEKLNSQTNDEPKSYCPFCGKKLS